MACMREQDYYFRPLLLFLSHAKSESVFNVILMSQKRKIASTYMFYLLLSHFCSGKCSSKFFFFLFSRLVHRHLTGYSSKGAAEQIHSRPERGGSQCHQKVPTLCSPGVRDPQCGDGLIQEEKVRAYSINIFKESFTQKLSELIVTWLNDEEGQLYTFEFEHLNSYKCWFSLFSLYSNFIPQPIGKCRRVFQALLPYAVEELCNVAESLIVPVRMGIARPTAPFTLASTSIDAVQGSEELFSVEPLPPRPSPDQSSRSVSFGIYFPIFGMLFSLC